MDKALFMPRIQRFIKERNEKIIFHMLFLGLPLLVILVYFLYKVY